MGIINDIQRTSSGETHNLQDSDIGIQNNVSVGYHPGAICIWQSPLNHDSDCGDVDSALEFQPENSEDASSIVSNSGQSDLQLVGVGHTETTASVAGPECHIDSMQKRILDLGLSNRTVYLHIARIRGPISRRANEHRLTLDEYLCSPEIVVQDLNKMYEESSYKANSIKCFYSTIRHYVLSRNLPEEQRETLMKHYDSEMAKFERSAINDVFKYKGEMINPLTLKEYVLQNYNPQKKFAYFITGLIYAQYPLRDDLTNIKYYKSTDYTPESLADNKNNYFYDDGSTVFIKLNKTKTIPRVYPPISLALDSECSLAIRNHANLIKDGILLKGRRSVILKQIMKEMKIETPGGAVNFLRRSHARQSQYQDIDTMLFVMGHSAKTHGRHYL